MAERGLDNIEKDDTGRARILHQVQWDTLPQEKTPAEQVMHKWGIH